MIDFYIGFVAGIKAFTAAVLGGIGSLPGAMLGGLVIGLIETFWSAYFTIEYKDVAAFSILAIVLIFLPDRPARPSRGGEGLSVLAEPGTSFGQGSSRPSSTLLAAVIAFALFACCSDSARSTCHRLTLQPRPLLLAIAVGIVFFGRLLLELFVWQAEHPLTTPFAKLFSSERFDAATEVLGASRWARPSSSARHLIGSGPVSWWRDSC